MLLMDGVLIIDKPAGMTSHDVVARVRKIIREKRVGHTGTLDPFATGVLVLLIGRATRIAQFLSGAEKEYDAQIRLGYSTDTGDITGTRLQTESDSKMQCPRSLRKEEIESAIASLRGEIEQLPPMYSAKKIAGRKLYEHARRGEEVARQPIPVTIREFELLTDRDFSLTDDGSIDIRARVVCSAGTYIRTLAEDLGKKLGMGAHLIELRRTRAGQFGIDTALTLERLDEVVSQNDLVDALISSHDALSRLPSIDLDDEQLRRTLHGLALPLNDNDLRLSDGDPVRLSKNNQLIAVGKYGTAQRTIHPDVVLGFP
jgi:tRNA pseudouridine55 synthase